MSENLNKLIGKRLEQLVTSTGLNQKSFGKKYNFPQSSLSKWMAGVNSLTLQKAHELIAAINKEGIICAVDWLCRKEINLSSEEHHKKTDQTQISPSKVNLDETLIREIALHKKLNPNFTFVLLPDDAMAPIFKKGDYIGGIAFYGPKLPQLQDGPYIIELSDGIKGVRNLKYNKEVHHYECSSVNPNYLSYTVAPNRFISVAKVNWHMLMT